MNHSSDINPCNKVPFDQGGCNIRGVFVMIIILQNITMIGSDRIIIPLCTISYQSHLKKYLFWHKYLP